MATYNQAIAGQKIRGDLERKTRKVFHEIHLAQADDPAVFNRLLGLLNTDYLGVEKTFFRGKVCLDAGCGSNLNTALALLQMGAKKVYAFDLDRSAFKKIPDEFSAYPGRYELSAGTILNIKFQNDFFDFIHCSGVLHHTANAALGLRELARVTKPGGMAYIMINGQGGIIREITNLLRGKYAKDKAFKKIIDNLDENRFMALWNWLSRSMREHGDMIGARLPLALIKELFNKDLVLTIKDRITAPIYNEYTEQQVRAILKKCGITNIRRITRYPELKNIRRFLCPFYYKYDSPFARMLFGEGCIQLVGSKI